MLCQPHNTYEDSPRQGSRRCSRQSARTGFVHREVRPVPLAADRRINPEGYRAYIDAAEAELRSGRLH
jgi:hypothetical protein